MCLEGHAPKATGPVSVWKYRQKNKVTRIRTVFVTVFNEICLYNTNNSA